MTPQLTEYLRLLPRIRGLDEALRIGDAYRLYHGMHCSLSMGVALERTCGLVSQHRVVAGYAKYFGEYVVEWLTKHADCFVRRDGGECGWEIRDERAGTANGTIQQLANVRIGCGLSYLVRAMDRCEIPLGSAEPIRACLAEALAWRMKADAAFCEAAITKEMNDKLVYLALWATLQNEDQTLATRTADAWCIPTVGGGVTFGDRRTIPPYGSWSTQKDGATALMLLELGEKRDQMVFSVVVAQQFRSKIVGSGEDLVYSKYPDGTGGYVDQWCDPSLWFMHPMLKHEARECAEFLAKCETDPAMKSDPTAKALWGDGTRMLIAACAM